MKTSLLKGKNLIIVIVAIISLNILLYYVLDVSNMKKEYAVAKKKRDFELKVSNRMDILNNYYDSTKMEQLNQPYLRAVYQSKYEAFYQMIEHSDSLLDEYHLYPFLSQSFEIVRNESEAQERLQKQQEEIREDLDQMRNHLMRYFMEDRSEK